MEARLSSTVQKRWNYETNLLKVCYDDEKERGFMAKGGVIFQDANELRKICEEETEAWDEACRKGEDPNYDEMLRVMADGIAKAKEGISFVDIKKSAEVLLFCRMLMESVSGDGVRVSYQLPQDYAGEAALVRIVGRDIELRNLTFMRLFKHKIGAIEIEDHTDGTIQIDFSFFGTLRAIGMEE